MTKHLISTATALLLALFPGAARKAVVIPVEFSDVRFSDFAGNVSRKVERAQTYFREQTGESFSFDVTPTVRLTRELYWYGANSTVRHDERIDQAVREACRILGSGFGAYDNDADGVVDNVYLIVAGQDESEGAGAGYVWPQHDRLKDRGGVLMLDGLVIDGFAVCTEFTSVGKFCHEFAHTLGLPDMYDTDGSGSGGLSKGLWGTLSLMDAGPDGGFGDTPPNFNAIELERLGLGRPLPFRLGYNTLRPIGESREYLRIDSDTENEYFLLECRKAERWDAGIGGNGMIIYHVDKSASNSWYSDYYGYNLTAAERWSMNQINCRPDRQCARVIEAEPGTTEISGIFFPQEGRTSFSSDTDPSFRYWNGNTSDYALDDIELRSDGSVSFNLIIPVSIESYQVFQDAAILRWHLDNSLTAKRCELLWYPESGRNAANTKSGSAYIQNDGTFNFAVEQLEPSTSYVLTVSVLGENGRKHSKTMKFTTKSRQSTSYPFIYLSTVPRNPDGSFPEGGAFPMRIYNARNVGHVEWFFNDKYIEPSSDGYWHFHSSGTLKAKIFYEDGSHEIITKNISVR